MNDILEQPDRITEAKLEYEEYAIEYLRESHPESGIFECIPIQSRSMSTEDQRNLREKLLSRWMVLKNNEDVVWCGASFGEYNDELGYKLQTIHRERKDWLSRLCWDKMVAPSAGELLWTALHGRILTGFG